MTTPKDGGPAFPRQEQHYTWMGPGNMSGGTTYVPAQTGMSLRDYFAAAVLSSMVSPDTNLKFVMDGGKSIAQEIAEDAYTLADAMIKARGE